MHLPLERAIAEPQGIVELTHRVVDPLRAEERAVVRGAIIARSPHNEQFGRRPATDLDEREVTRIALHGDVESRAEALDELELEQQGREFARRVLPIDAHRFTHDARAFLFRERAAKVAQEPRPHALRFTDVYDLTTGRVHAVDPRPVFASLAHVGAHAGEILIGGRRQLDRCLFSLSAHRWQWAQKTVVRPSIASVAMSRAPHRGQGSPPRPYAESEAAKFPRSPEASR